MFRAATGCQCGLLSLCLGEAVSVCVCVCVDTSVCGREGLSQALYLYIIGECVCVLLNVCV